ncbi:Nucleotide-binding universal stress protein, UspA family [Dyella sp. OK004]|uniref:universal stress protein n=1 Tax=Dyella sp. OK004 TaxID=1855292 RepID=UPI0008EE55B6|nr:universal stress protein [Dyella sp. OK004]SFS13921.1 Nucleotide-binding universal stress protein, UspA family [Dyella sp. OK004]
MFKHILLPTDGSELALRAVDIGIALAKSLGSQVHALYVATPFSAVTYFAGVIQTPAEPAYVEGVVKLAERCLEEVSQRANAAGVAYDGNYTFDHRPYTAIVGEATKRQCDLIVMGSHGRSGLDRLILGSETYRTMLSTDVPVLVCH